MYVEVSVHHSATATIVIWQAEPPARSCNLQKIGSTGTQTAWHCSMYQCLTVAVLQSLMQSMGGGNPNGGLQLMVTHWSGCCSTHCVKRCALVPQALMWSRTD